MPVPGLWSIGVRPTLAGTAVLLAAAAAGWGVSPNVGFPPVRFIRWWLERVALRIVRHPRWTVRTAAIFVNNSLICAALVLAGGLPAGAWVAVTMAGFSLGIAVGLLSHGVVTLPLRREVASAEAQADFGVVFGVALNALEIPAVVVTAGLAMGRLAAPNHLPAEAVWLLFVAWVVPALAVAAGGESLWIGRQWATRSGDNDTPPDRDSWTA